MAALHSDDQGREPYDIPVNGFLVPQAGGDPIPLVKPAIVIGRRPDCDIRLTFGNVSGRHCELHFIEGCWEIFDLRSSNGTRVNGEKTEQERLLPGDVVTIARKHHYRIEYTTSVRSRDWVEDASQDDSELFEIPLLDRVKNGRGGQNFDDYLSDDD